MNCAYPLWRWETLIESSGHVEWIKGRYRWQNGTWHAAGSLQTSVCWGNLAPNITSSIRSLLPSTAVAASCCGDAFLQRGQETSEDRRKNIHNSLLTIFLWRGRYVRQLWRFIFNKTMTTSKTHMEWFTPGIISWETEKCLYTDTCAQPLQAWAVQGEWRKLETEECKLVWSFPRKTVIAAKSTLAMTLVKSLISRKNVILFYYFPINVQNILKITFACHCLVFKCTIFM